MRRGEVRIVDFDPSRGNEASKRRPAVVVSNDPANGAAVRLGRGVITVVPLTTNVVRVFSFQVFLDASDSGLREDSKAQAEQIRAVDVTTVGPAVGRVPLELMRELDRAIKRHLAL